MYFISPTLGKLSIEKMAQQIIKFLQEEPQATYKVVIGTDSHTTKKNTVFVTALIIHKIGKGAQFFYKKVNNKPMKNLQHRIYRETELSLELIELLKSKGLLKLIADWPLEVHIDIGQQGETRKLIQEVVGWVTSIGFVAIIKPNSYGASSVADKFTS